ncbi:hypothetical protein AGMMS49942_13320 [Spirochaetia bacterium]|nr:hypothetical protein AGMMS49942_13320 [Spirochaetia bacterium]
MGMTVAPRARYENAIKTLFPQGDYWDKQFTDPESDVSLFAKAKLDELIRFRGRMSGLQDESRIETTDEMIADWERVLLDKLNYDKSLTERRLLLKSKENNKLNRAELQKIASMFGFTIASIIFPYRPAFFGWSRFNEPVYNPVVFSVLLFTVSKENLFSFCWEILKSNVPLKGIGRMRFGIDRMVYFPPRSNGNYDKYESLVSNYIIKAKNLFTEFETALQKILLANHIPLFWYAEGGE